MIGWKSIKKKLFVGKNVTVGENFHMGVLSWISASEKLTIGRDVLIGKYCTIQCNGYIGDGVMIANNVGVIGRIDHDFSEIGVLVSKGRHISKTAAINQDRRSWVEIEGDTWIGYGAVILSGVKIGRGALIAAGSVVINDVAPYDVVLGNPAKPISRRFTNEQIKKHEAALNARNTVQHHHDLREVEQVT
jgi:acetyltransferase-like isoleucine patch superfamily enzyme